MNGISSISDAIGNPPGQAAVCGIVVTFFPDPGFADRLKATIAECDHVIVVDNGSPSDTLIFLSSMAGPVELLAQASNVGLAAALNIGLRRALALGYSWAVTFDQDSSPAPGLLAGLWSAHGRQPQAAVIGPRIEEEGGDASKYRWVRQNPHWPWFFQRVACADRDLPVVTFVVSSGSLIELDFWARLGGFDEGLFIDYVDSDYCLKVLRSGRSIAVAAGATLRHRLGARKEGRLLGRDLRPMHHETFRHYYMARNRVTLWRRHALAVPHWALFDLAFFCLNGFRVMAFEAEKWAKFKAMVLGTWDGFNRRTGACPDYRLQAL